MNYDFTITDKPEPASFLKVKRVSVTTKNLETQKDLVKSFEFLDRKDSVGVLVYHKDKQLFTWVQQFRIGAATKAESSERGWTIEPVAGMVEPGQTPHQAAAREVFEEVGVTAPEVKPISSFLMCPGISNERMHLFFCEVENQPLNKLGGLEEEQENIQVLHWTAEETQAAVNSGKMDTAHACLLWQWVQLARPDLVQSVEPSYLASMGI